MWWLICSLVLFWVTIQFEGKGQVTFLSLSIPYVFIQSVGIVNSAFTSSQGTVKLK